MTDQPNTPTAPTVVPTEPDPIEEPGAGGRRRDPAAEAAHYRHQAKEAKAAADALLLERTEMRRQAIESLLTTTDDVRGDGSHAATLHNPADLFGYFGATPDEFYVDGQLDRAALSTFIDERTADLPHLAKVYVENVPPINVVAEALNRQQPRHGAGAEKMGPHASAWQKALQTN